MNLRDWVDPMCRIWGTQKRRVWFGPKDRIEGWGDSLLGRIQDEKVGASQGSGRVYQRHLECFTGDGLAVQRAIEGMPEDPLRVLYAHFVIVLPEDIDGMPPGDRKAITLKMGRTAYYSELNNARYWVGSRIDRGMQRVRRVEFS